MSDKRAAEVQYWRRVVDLIDRLQAHLVEEKTSPDILNRLEKIKDEAKANVQLLIYTDMQVG